MIVATRGLLRALTPSERSAVLAHERAHVQHHHHGHVAVSSMCASVNPLLWRVPAAVEYAVERWADEVAARQTSRAQTSTALQRVAALTSGAKGGHRRVILAAASIAVNRRIAALSHGPPALSPWRLLLAATLAMAALGAASVVTGRTVAVIHLAVVATHHVIPTR